MSAIEDILETRGLRKNFGDLAAVAGVDLHFREGELAAVIGPNGAGKTTFFNLVTGRLKPTAGKVYFRGRDITRLPPHRIARIGISRIFQITNLFPDLTVYQNIRVAVLSKMRQTAKMLTLDRNLKGANDETDRILDTIGLSDKRNSPCGVISHGDQRLVETGVALAIDPVLLLLDEPTGGMGPEETDEMVKFIRGLTDKQNTTILLVEHDMNVVFSVAERIVVMHQGEIIADGKPDEIRADSKVREAYLGEE
ncbi:MAG: ATP-binding cassette domain-containing protein [Proteobacteria bacterium]|nr:ATP-binding cassette domain-containing protein [Pseudomonadota bacterium]